ncbi:MAG: hypothetical protein OEY19_03200 [Gammaproteobacteria bacterium]|nr:hypothetical protein [Gammaproteobacteria bacterium]
MKRLIILLIFISTSIYAEEECVFSENSYIEFINKYSTENKNSKIEPDGKTLLIKRNDEEIKIEGGGCVHLGMTIESRSKQAYTEEQFLQKTLKLTIEFGDWLINTKALKNSISNGEYQKVDDIYYIKVDAMTEFEAYYDNQGKIYVGFYIN